MKKKVYFISLGCPKNLVDSEIMLGLLERRGFGLASRVQEADIAVVNTCGFIQPAVEEAIGTILEMARLKESGNLETLAVTGCLVQRYGYKLAREIPEVDGWLGTGEFGRIADVLEGRVRGKKAAVLINKPLSLPDHTLGRATTYPFFSAYLKIAEGCSHGCTFCLIPKLRGPFRSRTPESLLKEAEQLAERGAKEINVVAQDVTKYGDDLPGEVSLMDLLGGLVRIQGIQWVRLLYCHPDGITEPLLRLIESEEKICGYLDLPFQHVSEEILKAMGRGDGKGSVRSPWEMMGEVRRRKRPISVRTTLMVGFPGETEEMFEELCRFIEFAQFEHVGIFVYSPEKGTAAERLSPRVPPAVSHRRMENLLSLQVSILRKANQRWVGKVLPVLIEGACEESDLLLQGRTAGMAPEVDGRVLINKGTGLVGQIMPVRITEAHEYDLVGEILGERGSGNLL